MSNLITKTKEETEKVAKSMLLDTDIPILDMYLTAVISGEQNPAKFVAEEFNVKRTLVYSKLQRHKAYIREKIDAYFIEASVDKLKVLQEVKNIAFSNYTNIGNFDGEDMSWEDWRNLPPEVQATIKDVSVNENVKTGIKTVSITTYDKQKSMDQLIKMLEIGADKVKVVHEGEVKHEHRLFDNALED